MRLDRFDLNLLVVLDALLEERNVTRASARLHIGQSAASGALARLREYFGDELLVPVGRQLRLTPLAESLVEPVRDTLLRARATIARKPQFDPATTERRFLVCASDYVTTVMLAQAVERIAKLAPMVSVDIRSHSRHVAEVFDRGGIDLLVMPRQYIEPIKHPSQTWFRDDQVCMVWSESEAARSPPDFDQYMAMGHIAVRFGDERSITFEEWFLPRYGKQRRVEVSVDNFSTLPLLVVGTQRIATLHRRLAVHFARYLPLRLIAPPFEMPALEETMCWPRYQDQDPAHRWFREVLLDCAEPAAGSAVRHEA
jgi:LysR family transcriptional regulator, nod-box dependent transcriptional activator